MSLKIKLMLTISFGLFILAFQNFESIPAMKLAKKPKQAIHPLPSTNDNTLEFHKTQVIVKFSPSKIRDIERNISTEVSEYKPNRSSPQSNLLTKYNLKKMRPVFRNKVKEKKTLQLSELEIAKRFSIKSKIRHYQSERFESEELSNYYVIDIDTSLQSLAAGVEKIRQDPDVVSVERMPLAKLFFTQLNPMAYSSYSGDFAESMRANWDFLLERAIRSGKGQIVAVLDTGVDASHPDIAANVLPGWNTITNTNVSDDDHGHGTHVAGTIAAIDNNIGIIGMAHAAKILPVKVFDSTGYGTITDIVEGIVYATDNGADVINMSLGISLPCSQLTTLRNAVNYAINRGVVVVAAAGNSTLDVSNVSPASCADVIAVAASNIFDQIASFSNFGSRIDVAAPGVDIISLRAAKSTFPDYMMPGYSKLSGTSMATPHVAGLAAAILSGRPTLSPIFVRNLIRNTAKDIATAGFDIASGNGRIDPIKAVSTKSQKFDYNGDLYSDFLWGNKNSSGNALWLNGDSTTQMNQISSVGSGLTAIGDFNNDGFSDVWWTNVVRHGPKFTSSTIINVKFDSDWKVKGATDFDGNGASEVLFRNAITGENKYWKLSPSGEQSVVNLTTLSNTDWEIFALADFNGDSITDIFWRNIKTGENMIWVNGNSKLVKILPPKDLSWSIAGTGKFYYTSDIIWQNLNTNEYILWMYGGLWQQPTSIDIDLDLGLTTEWQIQLIANFKADTGDEIFFRNLVTGENKVYKILPRTSNSAVFYLLKNEVAYSTLFSHATTFQVAYGPSTKTPFDSKIIKAPTLLINEVENICGTWELEKCSSMTKTDLTNCPEGQYIAKQYLVKPCAKIPLGGVPYCGANRIALEIVTSDGSIAQCEGAMPSVIGNTNNVLGVNDDGGRVSGMTGPNCKNGNISGAFYNTLYGPNIGKCKSSCTLIGDCAANGKWKNMRVVR